MEQLVQSFETLRQEYKSTIQTLPKTTQGVSELFISEKPSLSADADMLVKIKDEDGWLIALSFRSLEALKTLETDDHIEDKKLINIKKQEDDTTMKLENQDAGFSFGKKMKKVGDDGEGRFNRPLIAYSDTLFENISITKQTGNYLTSSSMTMIQTSKMNLGMLRLRS
jgi:hypothetical protein